MTSTGVETYSPQVATITQSSASTGMHRSTQYSSVQPSATDISQITWEGIKSTIAAGGPPTTPLGKFFDWLLNIKNYPERNVNPENFIESSKAAETSHMRFILGEGKAEVYQNTLWAISVLFDRTIPDSDQTAQCVVQQLSGISSACQEDVNPQISGGAVVPKCTEDHPSIILDSTCLKEEHQSTAPLYTELAPGLYLNHTISWGNSSTALLKMGYDPDTDASMILHENRWIFQPVFLSETCRIKLESSFQQHFWRHLQPCFPDNDDRLSNDKPQDLYPKPPEFPTALATPFVYNSNPQPDELNLYYPHVRLEMIWPPMRMAMQWTIRVLPTTEQFRSLQQCIIQTLDERQTVCYDGDIDFHSPWYNNCTEVNDLFYGSLSGDYGHLGDLAKIPAVSTPLFDEISLEHRIITAFTMNAANPTSPPYFWPHDMMNETRINSPSYVQKIVRTFNETLLCSIAHCYPHTAESYERFKQCHLSPIPVVSISIEPSSKWGDINFMLAVSGMAFVGLMSLTILIRMNEKNIAKLNMKSNQMKHATTV